MADLEDHKTIEANGLRFAYLAAGEVGAPLALLCHGFPDTPHTWSETLPRLAEEGYRAIAPFMRGYHPTGVPADGDYSVQALGRDVLAWIEALGRTEAVVIGHDWGAYASYAGANFAPERITKLVTVAIPHPSTVRPGNMTPARAYRARHFVGMKLPGSAGRLRRNGFAGLEEIYRRWSPTWDLPPDELDAVKRCFGEPGALDAALGYYRALPLLRQDPKLQEPTSVPSLTLYGLDDGVADASLFEEARDKAFSAPHELVAIPDAGHFLHREQPDPFHEHLIRFLRA